MNMKIEDFQTLSTEELGKLYDSANDADKADIIHFVKKDANELISEVKAFIRETNSKIKFGKRHRNTKYRKASLIELV